MIGTSNSPHWCRRFEVPTPPTANSVRNFKSKSGTRIIELLVPLCFRSSCQSMLRCITNFGNGALDHDPIKLNRDHSFLFEHDLFPKTGSHFSGSCVPPLCL